MESFIFSFFGISGWGIDLDNVILNGLALEMNRAHSVIFETASKYCIWTLADYEGYSTSSKGSCPQ